MMARLSRSLVGLCGICWLLAAPSQARTVCGDDPTDADAVAATRAAITAQCNCDAHAGGFTHGRYVHCARTIALAARHAGTLPRRCFTAVMKCAQRSTVGRQNAVVCCTTSSHGVTRGTIKSKAALCKAPKGGSACMPYAINVCDGCTTSGCVIQPTPVPTPTPMSCPQPLVPIPPNLITVPLTLGNGTTNCGGLKFNPPASPPFSGEVDDVNGVKMADLGLGCLYAGSLPALPVPGGSTTTMSVIGVSGSALILGASDGSGPTDCTRGAGPEKHCINGNAGLSDGACDSDADCGSLAGGAVIVGSCALDAHCFFGPPVPTVVPPIGICAVNALVSDICGSADSSGNSQVLAVVAARLYANAHPDAPCPQCINSACSDGPNVGQPCSPIGPGGSTVECPPSPFEYLTTLTLPLQPLTSGTSTLTQSAAQFCPHPTPVVPPLCPPVPTAFGLANAGSIHEVGSGLGANGQLSLVLGGTFCLPKSGSFIDFLAGAPAPAALSATGTLDLTNALPLLP